MTRSGVLSNDLADKLCQPVLRLTAFAPKPVEDAVCAALFGHSAERHRLNRLLDKFDGLEIEEPVIGYRSPADRNDLIAKRNRLRARGRP